MLEFLLELVVKLGSFFYLILNTVMYLFAVHCILNRKNLRLGYSQTPATTLDLIILHMGKKSTESVKNKRF